MWSEYLCSNERNGISTPTFMKCSWIYENKARKWSTMIYFIEKKNPNRDICSPQRHKRMHRWNISICFWDIYRYSNKTSVTSLVVYMKFTYLGYLVFIFLIFAFCCNLVGWSSGRDFPIFWPRSKTIPFA